MLTLLGYFRIGSGLMKRSRCLILTYMMTLLAEVTMSGASAFQGDSAAGKGHAVLLAQAPSPQRGRTLDLAFWNSIKLSKNPADFHGYLEAFPNGEFAAEARARSEVVKVITPTTQGVRPADSAPTTTPALHTGVSRTHPSDVFYDIARETESQTEAATLYRLAAEAGDPRGAVELATRHEQGVGVPKSLEDALRWYQFAADLGDALGQHNLARLYEQGLGVDRNVETAMRLYGMAADQGLEFAALALQRLAPPVGIETNEPAAAPAKQSVHARCANILVIAQLGELSDRNRIFLQEECGK